MAEAIVYDALISWELERLFPQGARRVFVGKRSSRHTLPQEEINRLLVRLANEEGLRVVRLKGGDPFVFGRGGEEALALKEAGVPLRWSLGSARRLPSPPTLGFQ